MKRIEDLVKEIEKKDKLNRLGFIAFVLVIGGFMAYIFFSTKIIVGKDKEIDNKTIENSDLYQALETKEKETDSLYKESKSLLNELRKSMKPDQYWKTVLEQNSVKGYIDFLTNDWNIDKKDYTDIAIDTLKSLDIGAKKFHGWMFVGYKYRDGKFIIKNDAVEVIYRKNSTGNIAGSEIQIGDIVRSTKSSRYTYKTKGTNRRKNIPVWRVNTKAFVTDIWKKPNSIEYHIRVKYH